MIVNGKVCLTWTRMRERCFILLYKKTQGSQGYSASAFVSAAGEPGTRSLTSLGTRKDDGKRSYCSEARDTFLTRRLAVLAWHMDRQLVALEPRDTDAVVDECVIDQRWFPLLKRAALLMRSKHVPLIH